MSSPIHIPKFGLIIVGDEILSGLRQDKHLPTVIEKLNSRGLSLAWTQIIGDDPDWLEETLRRTFDSGHVVFSCGGIGGTPDDHTRQAAAKALGRPIQRHPGAVQLIEQRCAESGQTADEYRLRMADFPEDVDLIPNPFNKIAGFSIKQHYFVPGFPVMAWPMIDWVLDTYYSHLFHQEMEHKKAMRLYGLPEASITPVMELLEGKYQGIKLYSLPHVGDDTFARHIELGVKTRGAPTMAGIVQEAFDELAKIVGGMAGSRIDLIP